MIRNLITLINNEKNYIPTLLRVAIWLFFICHLHSTFSGPLFYFDTPSFTFLLL